MISWRAQGLGAMKEMEPTALRNRFQFPMLMLESVILRCNVHLNFRFYAGKEVQIALQTPFDSGRAGEIKFLLVEFPDSAGRK